MAIVGLDIGGASLKAADSTGNAQVRRFPLWRHPERLAAALRDLTAAWSVDHVAITMTGELCDCFATKEAGVAHILDSVEAAYPHATLRVWQTSGRFVAVAEARRTAWATAASNFLALATMAARWTDGESALLIDIGSTTTDLIPLRERRPQCVGRNDPQRLATGELVYQGIERTPLCALSSWVALEGVAYRTMAEVFATTLDVYLLLGDLPEEPRETMTADGRPATRAAARDRIGRMIGSDRTRFSERNALEFARQAAAEQSSRLRAAVAQVAAAQPAPLKTVVLSGQGEWLGRRLAALAPEIQQAAILSLNDRIGPAASRAACAYALTVLTKEML